MVTIERYSSHRIIFFKIFFTCELSAGSIEKGSILVALSCLIWADRSISG